MKLYTVHKIKFMTRMKPQHLSTMGDTSPARSFKHQSRSLEQIK